MLLGSERSESCRWCVVIVSSPVTWWSLKLLLFLAWYWLPCDFKIGSGWVTKRQHHPTQGRRGFPFCPWSLSLWAGNLCLSVILLKNKPHSKSREKILKHCHQSVIPFLDIWKVALIRNIPGFLNEYLCMAQGGSWLGTSPLLTHPSLCQLRAPGDHCPCSNPNHEVSLSLAYLRIGASVSISYH